jgi:hypothetical protein
MQAELDSVPNLTLLEGSVSDLLITPVQSESNTSKTVGKIQGIALGGLSSLFSLMKQATAKSFTLLKLSSQQEPFLEVKYILVRI